MVADARRLVMTQSAAVRLWKVPKHISLAGIKKGFQLDVETLYAVVPPGLEPGTL